MALSDDEVRKMAKARVEFKQHLATYAIINAMLVFIWFFSTGPGGGLRGFWPIWTMVFWGMGLAFHAMSVYTNRAKEEERVRQKLP